MSRSHWEPLSVRGLFAFALVCAGSVAFAADAPTFVGTWTTTYGQMVLTERGSTVSGTYGGRNGISGKVSGTKLTFTYNEPGVTGEGEFELSPDGQSFAGKWRPTGSASWSNWTGRRAPEANTPDGHNGPNAPKAKASEDEWVEPKPVVHRYGNLPQGLPAYFTDGDTDRDGQIGLYEWVRYWGSSEAKLAEFKALDLNGDGILTADEYQRATKNAPASNTPSKGGPQSWGQPQVIAPPPRSPGQAVEAPKKDDRGLETKRVIEFKK